MENNPAGEISFAKLVEIIPAGEISFAKFMEIGGN